MTDDVERQRAHFESISHEYLRARQHRNHLLFKRLLWAQALKNVVRLMPETPRVLEPMCGYSEGKAILERCLGRPVAYTGFDFSRPLVEEARARIPGGRVFVADVTQFEADGEFDVIILIGGLHHVHAHAQDVLRRLARGLRPGGLFVNFEPTEDNRVFAWIRSRIYRSNRIFDDATERAFGLDELNALYAAAGLRIRDQLYPGLLAYILYYNPDAFPSLNIGREWTVRMMYALEQPFYRTWMARKFSFATLSVLEKT